MNNLLEYLILKGFVIRAKNHVLYFGKDNMECKLYISGDYVVLNINKNCLDDNIYQFPMTGFGIGGIIVGIKHYIDMLDK